MIMFVAHGRNEFSVATLGQIVSPSALSGNKTFSSVTAADITSILICLFLRLFDSTLPTLRSVYEFIYRSFIVLTLLGLLCSMYFRVFSPSSLQCTCFSSALISCEKYELFLFRPPYRRCKLKFKSSSIQESGV